MSLNRQFAKLHALLGCRTSADDLAEEIRTHLQMEEQENLGAGMPAEEAHYAALRRFGNVTLAQEGSNEMWKWSWFEQLVQDVRYGLGQLRRKPGFTAVAVLTLALGIGANTAIFSLVDAVMLRMLPVQRPDELVLLKHYSPRWGSEASPSFTNPIWEQVRDQQDVFSGVFAWGSDKFDLAQGGAVHPANAVWVSGGFFNTLGIRPAAGRLLATSDDQR